ncbi:hypothetical protein EVG20_g6599, partial [Dentipellis fragilis]
IGHAASRIWFMARQLEMTLGKATGVRYRAAMSMIIESGLLITASQLAVTCTTFIDNVEIYSYLISDIAQMLMIIAPTLIIVRVGMGQGFDSVVETAHEHQASHGVRERQVRSIRFASHPTTTAEGSHLASVEQTSEVLRRSLTQIHAVHTTVMSTRTTGKKRRTRMEKRQKLL